jgi:superkiller protein 3
MVTYNVDNPLLTLPFGERLINALKIQLIYLKQIVAPYGLSLVYGANDFRIENSFLSFSALAVLTFWIAVCVAGIAAWRRRNGLGLAIPFYIVSAIPTANVFVVIAIFMAERLAYLPSAAVCLAIACLGGWLIGVAKSNGGSRKTASVLLACLAAYILWLGALTVGRNSDFGDPLRLWQSSVKIAPHNGRSWWYLGTELIHRGLVDEGEKAYLEGTKVDPEFPELWHGLALIKMDQNKPREALNYAEQFTRVAPGIMPANNILIARAYIALGQPDKALPWLKQVEPTMSGDTTFLETKGVALEELGRPDEALPYYESALASTAIEGLPTRLAKILLKEGHPDKAETVLRQALPRWNFPDHYNLLGVALAMQGKQDEAIAAFRKASELAPQNLRYRENLQKALSESRRQQPIR